MTIRIPFIQMNCEFTTPPRFKKKPPVYSITLKGILMARKENNVHNTVVNV